MIKDLLHFAIQESIRKRDILAEKKMRRSSRPSVRQNISSQKDSVPEQKPTPVAQHMSGLKQAPALIAQNDKNLKSERIPIPTSVKRLVWKKSQGQCCYQHQGHRCSSRFQLEIDHITPLSRGGRNEISNLQLLCRKHNQLKGFG